MPDDILAAQTSSTEDYEPSDVFLWANNLVPIKEDLKIELFLFNKNNVVYRTRLAKELDKHLQPLLIDNLLDFVLEGAGNGLQVREFEEGESEENVLQRARLKRVDRARELLNWLKTQEKEIETFQEQEHDMKRLKGLLARCSHPDLGEPFYIVKALPSSLVMKGTSAWLLRGGNFVPFDAEGSLRIPPDNQLMILGQDIYAFSQPKLESLFGYNAKKYGIAQKKLAEISDKFKFRFDEGLDLETLVQGKKALINKLQKLNPEGITQEDLLNQAEELGLELMTDNDGAIIIMSDKDLQLFINLLNEDYMESPLTGQRYEIKSKKPLKIQEQAYGEAVV